MVIIQLIIALLAATVYSCGQESNPTAAELFENTAPAVVLITTDKGGGTGFIVSPEGHIATALHIVDEATQVSVRTNTGEVFDNVRLISKDERKDIAILRIAGYNLPVLIMEDSKTVRPGQAVYAIGNPLAVNQLKATITDGIVSGIRDFGWGYQVIQISTPISAGNSGGPVVNERGRVIGMASFKIVSGANLNFAVPANYISGLLAFSKDSKQEQEWAGPSPAEANILAGGTTGGLTDYWKSSSGSMFYIKDHGDEVKVLNLTYPRFTYDLKWDGEIILGFIYDRNKRSVFVLQQIDDDRLRIVNFKHKKKWNWDAMSREAQKRLMDEGDLSVWIRMR